MKLLSFSLSGDFAAFRDPSVTSNQTVYYIPSKSSIIGILGAMIGIERDTRLTELYGSDFLDLFKNTKIGIRYNNPYPRKITFFTNHRSLKEPKMKPFKTELVENPNYVIYVTTNEEYSEKIKKSIENNRFVYSPYLGHVYCPAIINDLKMFDTKIVDDPTDKETSTVILDESESYKYNFQLRIEPTADDSKVIIERHIHHFFNSDNRFDRRVLKHWIPVNSKYIIDRDSQRDLSYFASINENELVCLF